MASVCRTFEFGFAGLSDDNLSEFESRPGPPAAGVFGRGSGLDGTARCIRRKPIHPDFRDDQLGGKEDCQRIAPYHEIRRLVKIAMAKIDCPAVSQISWSVSVIQRQGGEPAGGDGIDDRQSADQEPPLIDLGRYQRAHRRRGLPSGGPDGRDQKFGSFRCQWRQPLHQEKFVPSRLTPKCHQRLGERFGGKDNHGRGVQEKHHGPQSSVPRAERADEGGGPSNSVPPISTGWCGRYRRRISPPGPPRRAATATP